MNRLYLTKNFREERVNIFINKLYRNSLKNFVVSLYDGDELSRQDVKELREFLDEISTKSEEE